MQTARPISDKLGLEPQVWIDVHETGGMYHDEDEEEIGGMTREQLEADFPGYLLPKDCYNSGWWLGGREGEIAIQKRAARVVRQLWDMSRRTEETRVVAIISHGHFIGRVLQEVLGTPLVKFNHLNTGITCFDLPANERLGPQMHYINRIPLNDGPASVFDGGGAMA